MTRFARRPVPVALSALIAAVVAVVAVAAFAAVRPPAVNGSCAGIPSIEDGVLSGEVVFVGTVIRLENAGRWATVRVEERWRGARDLADDVQVRGGPEPDAATTTDRVFSPLRYLFVARSGPGYLEADNCSPTTPWTDDLAHLRPPGVSPAPDVVAGEPLVVVDLGPFVPVVALGAALVIAVVAYVFVLRARRRPPDWFR